MGCDFRFPNITGTTEREQLLQMKSYLYQLVEQLQFAVNDVSNPQTQAALIAQIASAQNTGRPSSSHNATATFSEIKSLIIKSADIVDAYYEEMSKKLEGGFVAGSDFGAFKEQTTHEITEASTSIKNAFTNIQTLETNLNVAVGEFDTKLENAKGEIDSEINSVADNVGQLETNLQDTKSGIASNLDSISEEIGKIDSDIQATRDTIEGGVGSLTGDISALESELQSTKNSVDGEISALQGELNAVKTTIETYANIKSGLLYYDDNGVAVYGVEVGQEDVVNGEKSYKRFARFIADRLSFFDQNEVEVAYVSNKKLYITHAEVKGNLQVGGYLIDTSKGLAFKWVGRG